MTNEARKTIFSTPNAYVTYDRESTVIRVDRKFAEMARLAVLKLIAEKKIDKIGTIIYRSDLNPIVTMLIRGKEVQKFLYPEDFEKKPKKKFKELAEDARKKVRGTPVKPAKATPIRAKPFGAQEQPTPSEPNEWSARLIVDKILD